MTSRAGAVLLHPHPDYGGDQHNVVVEALWQACGAAGIEAVRFDFASSDVARCVAQAVSAIDGLGVDGPVWVLGYSFGAIVGAHVLDERVAGWVLVAPPLSGSEPAGADPRPKLVLAPAHDQFCPPDAARARVASWAATAVEEVPSADHFLGGSSRAVADRAVEWVGSVRPGGR